MQKNSRFPRWLSGKEFTCQCRRHKRCRFDPRVGKIPWSRKWQPDPVFVSGKFHGQRFLGDYCPWGHEESDTIEHTHISTPTPVAISSGSAQRGWAKMPISHFPWKKLDCTLSQLLPEGQPLTSLHSTADCNPLGHWKVLAYPQPCWQAYGEEGTLIQYWWECNLVKNSGKHCGGSLRN